MSAMTTRKAITDVLKLGYTGDPPIFEENIAVPQSANGAPWARWSIRFADAFDSDVGGHFERIIGTLYFQHFNPESQGTIDAYQFSDKVGALFNRKVGAFAGGSIIFSRAVCAFAGQANGQIQHNVTIAFREDAVALNAP